MKDSTIQVRIDSSTRKRLEEIQCETGIRTSETVRRALEAYLPNGGPVVFPDLATSARTAAKALEEAFGRWFDGDLLK